MICFYFLTDVFVSENNWDAFPATTNVRTGMPSRLFPTRYTAGYRQKINRQLRPSFSGLHNSSGYCFVLTATCRDDLGMNSGAIPDSAINASSSYDFKSVGPQNSRSVPFVLRYSAFLRFLPLPTRIPPSKKVSSTVPSKSPDNMCTVFTVVVTATRCRYVTLAIIRACADLNASANDFHRLDGIMSSSYNRISMCDRILLLQ